MANGYLPDWYSQALDQYGALQNRIQGVISNVGASQGQAIRDTYAQQAGQASQDLASRGLGNTTLVDSTRRGLSLDEQKAQIALQNQLAQLSAGYMGQLGSAQLQFQTGYAQQQQQYQQQQNQMAQQFANQWALQQQQKTPFGYGTVTPLGPDGRPSRDARAYGYANVGGY